MKKKIIGLGLLLLGATFARATNGLENIIVEKYYVANAADAAKSVGALPVGSVTYRVYADLLPGYKFQMAYGNGTHTLSITTSTKFFNNQDRGAAIPSMTKAQDTANTVMLDSWLSVGAAAVGNFGILKSEDDGASTVTHNTALKSRNPFAGIPLTTQDGLIAGSPQAVTFIGFDPTGGVFDAVSNVGGSFTTNNGAWASLNGSVGPTAANKILIGQFTTDGNFQFALNIQIGTPSGGTETYVSGSPATGEILFPTLNYSSCPLVVGATAAISGPAFVCTAAGNSSTYTTPAINGASSFLWTVPTGVTILGGQGEDTLKVKFASNFASGAITVKANNVCGASATTSSLTLGTPTANPGVPAIPVSSIDAANICSVVGTSSTVTFSVTAVPNAGSYSWSVPTAATIVNGAGTNSIDVTFAGSYDGKGSVSVKTVSACGTFQSAASKSLSVKFVLPAAPKTVFGPADPAPFMGTGTKAKYYCAAVTGVTNFAWTVPAGATFVYGATQDTIYVTFDNTFDKGPVTAASSLNCGLSKTASLTLAKKAPKSPDKITGTVAVCAYVGTSNNPTYSIAAVAGATDYLWTAPTGASIATGQGTTSVTVHYTSGFTAGGDLTVAARDGFGGSGGVSSSAKKLTIATPVIPHAPIEVLGETGVCQFLGGSTSYSTPPTPGSTSYTWAVPTGATIASGAGTNSIVVNYAAGFTTGSITVASTSGCGTSSPTTLVVTSRPAKPVISGFFNVCPTTTTSYSVAAHTGATYAWTTDAKNAVLANATTNKVDITWAAAAGKVNVSESGCAQTSDLATITVKKASCKLVNGVLVPDDGSNNPVAELSVYPNPAQHSDVNILLNGINAQDGAKVTIMMYDVLGNCIYSNQKSYNVDAGVTDNINTAGILTGMYFVTVTVGDNVYKQKVVIAD